jgi:hypothetical protein
MALTTFYHGSAWWAMVKGPMSLADPDGKSVYHFTTTRQTQDLVPILKAHA